MIMVVNKANIDTEKINKVISLLLAEYTFSNYLKLCF